MMACKGVGGGGGATVERNEREVKCDRKDVEWVRGNVNSFALPLQVWGGGMVAGRPAAAVALRSSAAVAAYRLALCCSVCCVHDRLATSLLSR